MKKNLLILSMITTLLLTSCGDDIKTQTVPETPNVVEPQTSVEDLQVPFGGEEAEPEPAPEIVVESSEDLEIEETEEVEEIDDSEIGESSSEEADDGETSSTATEQSTSTELNGSETTTTTTTTTVETTPATSSASTSTSSTTSSTSTSSTTSSASVSSTTSSASVSSTTSSASVSSTTSSASVSSTTSSATTASTTQNINSYVDFYVVDMNGTPMAGVTTKFGAIAPSLTTDNSGKTRTQLTSTALGSNFADTLSLTYGHAFKANVTLLDSKNSNKNISHIETSEYSVLTKLNTATVNTGSSITVSDDQVISVIVMIDFNTASTNTSTATATSTNSDGAEINSSIYVQLDDRTYAYDYDYNSYTRDYNQVKVEVELLSPDRKESKMVTIYDSANGYGGTHKFRESEVEWLIGSLIVITSYHQFEVEMEFDDVLWREDRARAQSSNLGNGQYGVSLHDIVDETVNYGKNFMLYLIMDNKGAGANTN